MGFAHNMFSALSWSNRSGQDPHAENPGKSPRGSFFYVSMLPEGYFLPDLTDQGPTAPRSRKPATSEKMQTYVSTDY